MFTAFNNHATSQFYSFFEQQQPIGEKTNAKLPDPHHPLPILSTFLHLNILLYYLFFHQNWPFGKVNSCHVIVILILKL